MKKFSMFVIGLFLVFLTTGALAQTEVTFAWDANPETDLMEYRLYQDGSQVAVVPAGTETYMISLADGTYQFTLTAVDTSENESAPTDSVEVVCTSIPPPDTTPPAIPTGFHVVEAEPPPTGELIILGVSGTLGHGNTITISGSGFGEKSPAPPLLWDDCENKTVDTPSAIFSEGGYSDSWQLQDDYWKSQYRSVSFRNVSGPHSHSTKYIAGGHQDETDHRGRNVHVTIYAGVEKPRWFAIWYVRYDPLWPACGSECANCKITDLTTTDQIYTGDDNLYIDIHQYGGAGCGRECSGMERMCLQSQEGYCGYNTGKYDGLTIPNPTLGWVHYEQRVATDSMGLLQFLGDNDLGYDLQNCPNYISGTKSISLGGFYRYNGCASDYHTSDDAFRYFDDIYVDNTFSRVMLANDPDYESATIVEPQIPSAWSEDSITCAVNAGKLSGTAYLFVFDADNEHSEGYQVTIQ